MKVLRVSPVLVERARQEVSQLTAEHKPVSEGLRRVSQVTLVTDSPDTARPVHSAPRTPFTTRFR